MTSHSGNFTPVTEQPSALIFDAIMVLIVAFAMLLSFQLYVDNVFIVTTNGLWKSVLVHQWAENPELSKLDLANLLYYPAYGQLTRLLDVLGVFTGTDLETNGCPQRSICRDHRCLYLLLDLVDL